MADNESKTFWVAAEIEEAIHTALFEVATMVGKHPRKLVEMGVELVIAYYVELFEKEGKPVPVIAKLETMLRQDRARQLRVNQIKIMAYNHVQNPTEDSADRLAEACELAGISIESLMEEINDKPQLIEVYTDGGSLSTAEFFLLSHMKPGELYPAKEIIEGAKKQGIKEYVIKDAKRKQGIESVRMEKEWCWRVPAKEKKHQQETAPF